MRMCSQIVSGPLCSLTLSFTYTALNTILGAMTPKSITTSSELQAHMLSHCPGVHTYMSSGHLGLPEVKMEFLICLF